MAGPLRLDRDRLNRLALQPLRLDPRQADPLWLARLQDALGWLTLALVLVLAPWARLWRLLGLPQPSPASVAIAAGVVLAVAAGTLLRARSARAVAAAAAVNAVGALAVAAWWLARMPAHGTRGTFVLAAIVVSLVVQASFDLLMLRESAGREGAAGPSVEPGSDRP